MCVRVCVRDAREGRLLGCTLSTAHTQHKHNTNTPSPQRDVDTVVAGVAALADELSWFKAKAAERGLELHDTGV